MSSKQTEFANRQQSCLKDAVLVEDKWLDYFYQMNVWVKNPDGDAQYYFDTSDILNIIPELYKNGNIIYSKVALINFIKIKALDREMKHNKLVINRLNKYVSFLVVLLVLNIALIIIQ